MMRFLVLVIALLVCGDVGAQTFGTTGLIGRTTAAKSLSGGTEGRRVTLCFIPDTQNIVAQDDQQGDGLTNTLAAKQCAPDSNNDPTVGHFVDNCQGSYCTKSPYCNNTWINTGRIMMKNLAYEMTGQCNKIDWTTISGNDPTNSFKQCQDHPRCDAIISLGDMLDINSDGNLNSVNTPADLVTFYAFQNGLQQWQTDLQFWDIIKGSGIPFLPVEGNHDPPGLMDDLFTFLDFTHRAFYFDTAPSGLSAAIKFNTGTGKQFCIISTSYQVTSAADMTWRSNNIGCGNSLPTIFVSHNAVSSAINSPPSQINVESASSASSACIQNLVFDGTKSAMFMIVGGHATPAVPTSVKQLIPSGTAWNAGTQGSCTVANSTTAFSYFALFSDWQETNRHGYGNNSPYGNTPHDSGGMGYTVVEIDPGNSKVYAYDWSPYWNTRGDPNNELNGLGLTTNTTFTFNFDARFP